MTMATVNQVTAWEPSLEMAVIVALTFVDLEGILQRNYEMAFEVIRCLV
jgi:hypothetical protein